MKWVTRERPKIDRLACPWLITRFIDREPEFLYVPSDQVLATAERTGAILDRVEPAGTAAGRPVRTEADLPPPRIRESRAVEIVGYPESNPAKPGEVVIAWPPAFITMSTL